MSGANMKLCVVHIDLADDAAEPVAKPEEGEFIEKHLVPLKALSESLSGEPSVERYLMHASDKSFSLCRLSEERLCSRCSSSTLSCRFRFSSSIQVRVEALSYNVIAKTQSYHLYRSKL
jgi:hypothetical protein